MKGKLVKHDKYSCVIRGIVRPLETLANMPLSKPADAPPIILNAPLRRTEAMSQ